MLLVLNAGVLGVFTRLVVACSDREFKGDPGAVGTGCHGPA